jgi:hypothetical protein
MPPPDEDDEDDAEDEDEDSTPALAAAAACLSCALRTDDLTCAQRRATAGRASLSCTSVRFTTFIALAQNNKKEE